MVDKLGIWLIDDDMLLLRQAVTARESPRVLDIRDKLRCPCTLIDL